MDVVVPVTEVDVVWLVNEDMLELCDCCVSQLFRWPFLAALVLCLCATIWAFRGPPVPLFVPPVAVPPLLRGLVVMLVTADDLVEELEGYML